ncbi:hypothetical protein QOZ80_3AG0207700 [Eleusine coracana subsp. coracana]|nr:hypothetical protein QOZ80_3AG0207700 [Eleusine coracana subsp. coracana]
MEDGVAAKAPPRNLGGSLPVPNVQDLAARIIDDDDQLITVLDRYLRPDVVVSSSSSSSVEDAAAAITDDDSSWSVPVVDLGRLLLDPDELVRKEEAGKLRSACEDWGFFQVVNHGVPAKVMDAMKDDLNRFFKLPLQEKLAVAQEAGGVEGYGQAFVVSEEQRLDYSDMYFLFTQPPEYRNLNLWPSSNPSTFRDSMERYSVEVQRVATDLLRVMAKNLGLSSEAEKRLLTRVAAAQSMRMNYYPACPESHADKVLGLSPHSDAVGLTLLLQVTTTSPGLQIRRQGRWVPVAPLPGALIANVGDVVEVLTNGKYKSVEHRAVVSASHERVSMAAFHTARFDDDAYGPLQEMMLDGGEQPRYRTMSVEDYVKLVFSSKLDGKNIMDAMKINPSPSPP